MRKLIYLIAVTADGFIADEDGNYDAFPISPELLGAVFGEYPETCPAHLRAALSITAPARHFDTVLMGADTHQPALDIGLTSAYPHLRQFVFTHRTGQPADKTVTYTSERPATLVDRLKHQHGRDIWLCGGGNLAGQLVDQIDEFHLKVNPVLLGRGIPLLGRAARVDLELFERRDLPHGIVLHRYRKA